MLSGWTGARESKLTIFGGPFVALTLYAVIGWILMITPENIANLIYLGMPEIKDNIKSILHVNLEVKETLGSVQIRKYKNGYTRAYNVQLCHIYMHLTFILPFATIVALEGSANSKACHTYNIPHATIQSKCSHTGVNLLSYKHATFH